MNESEVFENMSSDDVAQLAADLRHRHMTGSDDRALVTFLSDHYRVKKRHSRAVLGSYFRGFRAGADSVFSHGGTMSPPDSDLMFAAAFNVGRTETERYIENQRYKLIRGFYGTVVCILLILCMLGWHSYRWFSG